MIGALSSWSYPLRGILCLSRTPQLRQLVQRFLLSVTATSAATSCVWLYLFYNRHVQLIANVFGGAKTSSPGLFTKATAALVVLAESTLPVYLLFGRRFEQLQQQLFDATVQLQAVHFSQLLPTEQEALAAAVAARQQQRAQAAAAAAAAWRGMGMTGKAARLLLGGVTNVKGFITQLVLKPEPHEGLLIRQVRGVVTGVVGGLLPPLLPVLALRDSGVAAARLLGRYWDKKGVPHSADARTLVAQQHAVEYRSFGLVAAGLGYVPLLHWLLGLSNMVAAALLAADMEKKQVPLFVSR